MKNSVISGNKAIELKEGAFSTFFFGKSLVIFNNTIFKNNIAVNNSGGVFIFTHNAGTISMINSIFREN